MGIDKTLMGTIDWLALDGDDRFYLDVDPDGYDRLYLLDGYAREIQV